MARGVEGDPALDGARVLVVQYYDSTDDGTREEADAEAELALEFVVLDATVMEVDRADPVLPGPPDVVVRYDDGRFTRIETSDISELSLGARVRVYQNRIELYDRQ